MILAGASCRVVVEFNMDEIQWIARFAVRVSLGAFMFKKFFVIAVLGFTGSAFAQDVTCTANAAEKKLSGAAKTSFLKKCEKDAAAKCEMASKEKKLSGAAKSSFSKKCVKDAVGAA
jgi:hypothetical protein